MNESTTIIIGNCTRDPELKFTNSGASVASFGVAVNRRKKNDAGEWEDGDPSFFNITCWQSLADHVAESVTKGQRVIVCGRLEQRSWENDAGEKRTAIDVVADEVGPSLRWATAEVKKAERSGPTQQAARPVANTDEEPF